MSIDERSAGVVLFRVEEGQVYYLLLHYIEGHWDFPKGHIEPGESIEDTIRRELKEETGIEDLTLIPGFSKQIYYKFRRDGDLRSKCVEYRLGKTGCAGVTLSPEHKGYGWYVYYNAIRRVTYPNARDVLRSAERFLRQQGIV